MSLSAFPDLSLGLSSQLTSGANGDWLGGATTAPQSFDHSAWNVSIGSSGNQGATGSSGQGATTPAASGAGLLAGIRPQWLVLGVLAYLLLKRGK